MFVSALSKKPFRGNIIFLLEDNVKVLTHHAHPSGRLPRRRFELLDLLFELSLVHRLTVGVPHILGQSPQVPEPAHTKVTCITNRHIVNIKLGQLKMLRPKNLGGQLLLSGILLFCYISFKKKYR